MRKLFLIPILGLLVGCALAGGTNLRFQGTDLKYQNASGSGNLNINSRHCWAFLGSKCPSIGYDSNLNSDLTNEYIRSSSNSSN